MTPSNANTSGLAPCPFCGGAPFDRGFRRWECGSCGAQGPAGSKADATNGWNRRVTAASAQDRIAELESDNLRLQAQVRMAVDAAQFEWSGDRQRLEARADRLARFGQHTNWELSFCYLDDDDEDGCWTVHSVNGGLNDREWTVIGRGEAPDDAIRAALQQETQK